MAVIEQTPISNFTGNGVTTVFAFDFLVPLNTDLLVIVGGATQALGTDYTVAGTGVSSGGTVTFTTAPGSGVAVSVVRNIPATRSTDYQENGDLLADVLNDDFDRIVLMVQDATAVVGVRAVRGPVGESLTDLPPAASRANTTLGFDSDGQPTVLTPDTGSAADVLTRLADTSDAAKGDALVGVKSALTGAVATTQHEVNSRFVSVMDFGAVGDGPTTDDTPAFVLAQAAVPDGGVLFLPPGKTYKVGTVDWTGKAITIMGYGATVLCTHATGAFYKTDHGNKLTIAGVKFTSTTAGARAVNHQSAQEVSVYDELQLDDCSFTMNGAFGLYLVGTREPRINSCTFFDTNGGDGVYCKDTVAPSFNDCLFKGSNYTRRGFHYPGTGTAFDASPMLFNCEIMGWDVGLEVVGCDSMVIIGGTFDYCNWTMKLASQDGGKISKAYIGSLADNPGVWITSDASATSPDHCEKLVFESCTFTGHYTGGATYDNVLIDGAVSSDHLRFDNCFFTFYTRYGLQFTTTGRLSVSTCTFVPRATFGVAPIYNATGIGDSGVIVKQNIFPSGTTVAAMNLNFAAINENYACATEARGEAFVGSGVSTYNQAHGLAYTPAKSDIQLTPTNSEAAGKNPFVSSVDSTNIVIGFTSATAATAGVAWRARRGS